MEGRQPGGSGQGPRGTIPIWQRRLIMFFSYIKTQISYHQSISYKRGTRLLNLNTAPQPSKCLRAQGAPKWKIGQYHETFSSQTLQHLGISFLRCGYNTLIIIFSLLTQNTWQKLLQERMPFWHEGIFPCHGNESVGVKTVAEARDT